MIESVFSGLGLLANPAHFGMLMVGVLIGILVGIIPGLGGLFAFAMLTPYIIHFDPASGIALLIGVAAVANTADTISSVLLAVPGTPGGAATIIDGHAMARKGQASRALSTAFAASALGGLVGAALLAISIPITRPLIKQFLSPEIFMLCLLGLGMTAVLSGRRPLRGLAAGMLGLLLAAIGTSPMFGFLRFTFDIPYLFDGVPLVLVALGLFAIPEIIEFMLKGTPISMGNISLGKETILGGLRNVIKEKWLFLRCSLLGTWIGFLPGLGPSVAAWLGYGHAVQSAKDKSGFGSGDVRGVIAPECANNAVKGGELIISLTFGVPGSGTMAIFIIVLTIFGFFPGPKMMTEQLPMVYMIAWSLAIANVVGAAICTGLARPLAQVARVPGRILAPFVLMVVLTGAYQTTQNWGDLLMLIAFGILGIFMKQFEFSRPPLLIGFVLGPILERSLWLSVRIFDGTGWLLRPWVIVLAILLVFSLFVSIRWQMRRGARKMPAGVTI